MSTKTLAELRTAVLARADFTSTNQFVPTAVLDEYINSSISDLYDLALDNEGQTFLPIYEITVTTGAPAGGNIYAVDPTAYKVLGVYILEGGKYYALDKLNLQEIPVLRNRTFNRRIAKYRVQGGFDATDLSIQIFPQPPAGVVLRVEIVTEPFPLVLSTDATSFPNRWEEYVILDAAMKCLEKEESDTSDLRRRFMLVKERIENAGHTHDKKNPETVTDVTDVWEDAEYWRARSGW